jgi:kynurenine formamidase
VESVRVNFNAATSLALPLQFAGTEPQHFGAPAAHAAPFHSGDFSGSVVRGAGCNCQRISLIPHCNGTHTESASHLTVQQRPLREFVPLGPMRALLVTLRPVDAVRSDEDSIPTPQPGDQLITRSGLRAAWPDQPNPAPRALLLRTAAPVDSGNPPYCSRQFMLELVARDIEHLVVDLPSVDRSQDQGRLTAHRIFFGMPASGTDLATATRAHCTITELAQFPAHLADGPCALQLQLPDWDGDAVPSRPLYLPVLP